MPQNVNKVTSMLLNNTRRYPLSLLTALVIIVLSLYPFGEIELAKNVPLADKWTHMVMYGGFTTVLWLEYWRWHDRLNFIRTFCWAVLLPIAMSGILELLQEYATTCRSGEWLDLLANSIGVLIGALLGNAIHKMQQTIKEK